MSNLKYIGKNVLNHTLELKKGNVSGSATSTGSFGRAEATKVYAADGFYHTGNDSTYLKFPTGYKVQINAGDVNFIYAWQRDADVNRLIFNEDNTDTDIIFRSANGSNNKLLYLDASADKIGIKTGFPTEALTVEGNISASGALMGISHITASGNISASNLYLDEYIYHSGEPTQTYIRITDKRFRFNAGGISYLDMNDNAGPPRDITFNDGGNNVDLTIKGSSNNPLFKTDANLNRIGTHGKGSPEVAFHIGGSELRVDGNISGSSTGTGSFGTIQTTTGTIPTLIGDTTFRDALTLEDHLYIPDSIVHASDTNTKIRFPEADTIAFNTSGLERLRITSDGQISGSAVTTGSFGQLEIGNGGDIILTEDQRIYFEADKLTYIESNMSDSFRIVAGNSQMFLLDQDTGNRAVFGNSVKVFIGANNHQQPSNELEVDGTISGAGILSIDGNITGSGNISGSGTGSFGLVEISGMDIDPTGVARDQVLKFNGTNFVPAAYNATFEFSISSFSMNHTSTPVLIGSGSWKSVGGLTFTAAYNNGPPDGYNGSAEGAPRIRGYVDGSVSSSYDMYPLSSSFTSGTNTMVIGFPPDSGDDIRFLLQASAGSDTDTSYTSQRIYFRNQFVYGDLSKNNGFNQADIRTLAADNSITHHTTARTLTVSVGGSNYLCFAHRTGDTNVAQVQCGTGTNILTVGMDRSDPTALTPLKEEVSYLNTAGYTENFYVYASAIVNVDAHSTTFNTLTSTQKKNYFIWGYDSQASSYDESFLETSGDWDSHNANSSYDDGTITSQTLSVGSFTSKYVMIAFPDRYGDNESQFQFKDNSTGLPFDVTKQSDQVITNAVGFRETYHVWRSTNLLTMTNLTVLIDSV